MSHKPRGRQPMLKKRLKHLRELRGLTQKQLADRAGLPPSSIGHFETDGREPSCANLCRVADVLGCSTDYLLGRSDSLLYDRAIDGLAQDYAAMTDKSQHVLRVVARVLLDADLSKVPERRDQYITLMSDRGDRPHYDEVLSVPTLMGLLATYTERILITNEAEEDEAFAHGRPGWDEAYVFGVPKALLLGEVNRMAQWCITHRQVADAAMRQARLVEMREEVTDA